MATAKPSYRLPLHIESGAPCAWAAVRQSLAFANCAASNDATTGFGGSATVDLAGPATRIRSTVQGAPARAYASRISGELHSTSLAAARLSGVFMFHNSGAVCRRSDCILSPDVPKAKPAPSHEPPADAPSAQTLPVAILGT